MVAPSKKQRAKRGVQATIIFLVIALVMVILVLFENDAKAIFSKVQAEPALRSSLHDAPVLRMDFARHFLAHVKDEFYGNQPSLEMFLERLPKYFPHPKALFDIGAAPYDGQCFVEGMAKLWPCANDLHIYAFEPLNFAKLTDHVTIICCLLRGAASRW